MTNTKVLQIKLPHPTFLGYLRDSVTNTANFVSENSPVGLRNIVERLKKFPENKKFFKILLLLVIASLLVFAGGKALGQFGGTKSGKIQVKGASATQEINKEYSFPLLLADGKEVSRVKYMVEQGELRDEIVVKGQKATAITGRVFLIFTLKINNEYTKSIEMNTRDYIRLSVNGNRDEWLAPDIHNDPVEVQAISTKYTRVGFAINETDRDLILRVGEIDGEKEEIPLTFN